MTTMKGNPGTRGKGKRFTIEEDICILDKVITRLKVQKLSSAGFLSNSVLLELAKHLQRSIYSLRTRWEMILQPWLLQHYTGTTGFRVERMLTRLVAAKFSDHRGIDWSEIVNKHKEFVGHTSASLRHIFHKVHSRAKEKKNDPSLQEVADYAAEVYQPGKEKEESAAMVVLREKIILYFKEKVADLGINVVI